MTAAAGGLALLAGGAAAAACGWDGATPMRAAGRATAALGAAGAVVVLAALGVAGAARPLPMAALAALAAILAASAAVDAHTARIPNALSAAAALAAATWAIAVHAPWPSVVGGGAAVALTALVAWRLGGMGMGDAKLLSAVALALGPFPGLAAFAVAATLGGIVQMAARLARLRAGERFAFAPYIAVATLATLALTRPGSH